MPRKVAPTIVPNPPRTPAPGSMRGRGTSRVMGSPSRPRPGQLGRYRNVVPSVASPLSIACKRAATALVEVSGTARPACSSAKAVQACASRLEVQGAGDSELHPASRVEAMIGDEIDLVEAELTRGGHMAGAEDGCGHELDYWFSDHRRGWLSAWIEETRHRPHHRLLSPVGAAQSRLPSSGSRGFLATISVEVF